MLTPDEIDALADAALEAFAALDDAMRTEAAVSVVTDATRADLEARLAAIVGRERRTIERTIATTLRDAARTGTASDEVLYQRARVAGLIAPYAPLSESATVQRILTQGIATVQSMGNLVATRALQAVIADFTAALDSAMLGLSTGAADPASAIRTAVDAIARTDTTINYVAASGRTTRSSIYGAVRRAVLTGANQTTLRIQEARLAEVGGEYVQVTAHMGARPEHAEWQGGVYRFDELPAITGYGEVDGLGGANCRHSWFPFFPGIMEPTDFSYIDSDDNAEQYALSQRQREAERKIRRYQSRANSYAAAAKASGDKALADEAQRNRDLARKWRSEADSVAAKRNGARRRDREAASAAR